MILIDFTGLCQGHRHSFTNIFKKTNQITLLSTEGNLIHCVITSQTNVLSKPGPIMDDITFYWNMLNLVWFFDNGLWREVVVSIRCLALMCRSFLTTIESVSPPPTCHWGTRSFASQTSLGFSSPPGHKLFRPGIKSSWSIWSRLPYGRQLDVTFWKHLNKERFTI